MLTHDSSKLRGVFKFNILVNDDRRIQECNNDNQHVVFDINDNENVRTKNFSIPLPLIKTFQNPMSSFSGELLFIWSSQLKGSVSDLLYAKLWLFYIFPAQHSVYANKKGVRNYFLLLAWCCIGYER